MTASHLALEAVVRQDGRTISRCLLRRGRYIIGSAQKNEIVASGDSVSAKHARLTVASDEHFFLEDLGSANGTFVNGVSIEALTPLSLDSTITFGEATLVFERGGLPASIFRHLPAGFLRVSRYVLGEAIVEGRTSTIFEAQDTLLRRRVAMKVLHAATQADADQVLAFIRDTQIVAQLPHAGLLPIFDFGLDPDIGLFSTTRFIEGESLAHELRDPNSDEPADPPPSFFALLQIFLKACSAVAFAHRRGVVHTALHPEAILFGRFGEVFVDRWGFAQIQTSPDIDTPLVEAPAGQGVAPLSRYSAPEQADGETTLDPRTDVHALGAILFRLLTGKNYVGDDSPEALLAQLLAPPLSPGDLLASYSPPPHFPDRHWPERLAAACVRALSPQREDRFADAQELKREVDGWLESVVSGGAPAKRWKPFSSLLGQH